MKTGPLSKLALRAIGLPHLGFRGRARVILDEAMRCSGPETRILDAGCGYGLYSLSLAARGKGVIDAIDLDPARIAALERMKAEQPELMGRISLRIGSVTELPFPNETFDIAICSEVVEHVPDHERAIRELARVVKPGGMLILTVPYDSAYNRRIYKKFGHERPGYTKERLAILLGPGDWSLERDAYYEYALGTRLFNGFNAISSKPLMGLLFYPFYALYRLDAALKIGEPNGIVTVFRKKTPAPAISAVSISDIYTPAAAART